MATRVVEKVARAFAGCGAVDRDKGVIRDVLVCGLRSLNGRDYPWDKGKLDHRKYEGRPVNSDHGREATVSRRLGWFENVRPTPKGPRGDFHVLKSHPLAAQVFEAAERNPSLFGFSHVVLVDCSRGSGGREVVEAIREVESIDLVADPATTRGLFEGKQGGRTMRTTLRRALEAVSRRAGAGTRGRIREALMNLDAAPGDVADAPDDPMDDPGAATDPDEAIDAAFKAAMHAQVDALLDESHTLAEFITKCRELFKARQKIVGKSADGSAAEESRRRRVVLDDADSFRRRVTLSD